MTKGINLRAPMGWNSWDCYGAAVTEDIVRANAEYMAKNLKDFGWEYICVDIQWSEPTAVTHDYHQFTELCMDEYSRLIPATNRFPSAKDGLGFKSLGDYIHSLGLKFGIHIMRGIPRQAVHRNTAILGTTKTAREIARTESICQWNTDMYGVDPKKEGAREYYESLFKLYASWGVDFIKCDDICREMPDCEEELKLISASIKNCGRDMVFSLSPGPAKLDYSEFYKETAHMWRITDDFWDTWPLLLNMFDRAREWSIHSGAGNWPDCDMLPIGPIRLDYDKNDWTKFTEDEQYTMLSLWCIMRSPLIIGGDMTGFDKFTLDLVTNADILNMHLFSRHAHEVWRKIINGTEHILWTAVSAEGGQYVALFNVGEEDSEVSLDLSELEIYKDVSAKELWSGETLKSTDGLLKLSTKKHGATVLKLS